MSKSIKGFGGGGGCFAAGTIVRTPDGDKEIQRIKVGDLVYSFDEFGTVKESKVLKIFVHENDEVYKVSFWGGSFDVTLNHWVLNQYNSFVEVGTLTQDDCLVDSMGHLRPVKSFEFISEQPVYNLTVEDNHTFIANNIRVHNGGKGTVRGFGGGGGSKGGGGSVYTPTEAADSIRSKQFARIVDLVSEGEIEGLADGLKSVYLDSTPIQNSDGSYNFSDVTIDYRYGTQDQTYIHGFPSVEAETNVSVEVKYATSVTRQITNQNVNRVRVTMSIPALYQQQTNGDTTGTTVQYAIDVQTNGGGFIPQPMGRQWGASSVSTDTFTTPYCYGIDVSASATIASDLSGSYSIQYKSSSDISWTTITTKTLNGGVTTTTYIADAENGGYYSTVYGYGADLGITGSITGLAYGVYNVRVIRNSGSGSAILTAASTLQQSPTITISDKTSSRYQRSHEITLTGTAPWDIRVRRITADPTSLALQNKTYWESYTTIIDAKLSYPNSAVVGIQIDASQFSHIPTRAYDLKLLKIKIPSNYNPTTRVYTGIWDGTFSVAWSDNPAWCFYDLITNERYGLGSYIDTSLVDTAQLYQIAQYCDELVSDGFGGVEPRFTCNLYLQTREEAYKVIANMASIFRGMTYWSTGSIFAVQDSPADVYALFNNSDVINGEFNYSGSAGNTRHSVALVTWNDPSDSYKQKVEYVEDATAIARFGVRETELTAIGCTSRGQAHRMGKWLLYTERYETELLSFKTGLKGAFLTPGRIIQTMDTNRVGTRFGGRVLSSTTTSVTIDSAVTIESGKTYTLSLVLPDSTIVDRVLTNAVGSTTALTFVDALATQPQAYGIWVLKASDLTLEKWRIVSVSEDKHIYTVNAVAHYDQKYDLVESNLQFETPNTTYITTTQSPVTEVVVSDSLYYLTQDVLGVKMLVSWKAPTGATRYEVTYKTNNQPSVTLPSSAPSIDIFDVVEGTYTISIVAFNALGNYSVTTTTSYTVLGQTVVPSDVSEFAVNAVGVTSYLYWSPVSDLDLNYYQIKFSPLTSGVSWNTANVLIERIGKSSTSISVPTMSGTYLIKAFDYYGNSSQNAALVTTNIDIVNGLNVVALLTEDPTFAGIKTNVEVIGTTLQLSGSVMSTWTTLGGVPTLRYGLSGVSLSGIYNFFNTLDLGAVYTSRLGGNIVASGSNLANVMSMWASLASVETLGGTSASTWGVQLQVRTTDDDPAGTPTWSSWMNFIIGDYSARAFEFRLLLSSTEASVTPIVETLEVSIDMPDRVYGENDLVCGTTGLTVTYSPAFKASPHVAISAQGLATGDYYQITSKTATGFTIIFKNSSNVAVSRTFDYVAKGYGYVT